MSKLSLPERAKRFAKMQPDVPTATQEQNLRYGFMQGFRACQRDLNALLVEEVRECTRRFFFLAKHRLWEQYNFEK